MNLLKADAMWELKYFIPHSIIQGDEIRFVLCRHWENGGPPRAFVHGIPVGTDYNAFNNYWDDLSKTEAEAWEHLPNYLKDDE